MRGGTGAVRDRQWRRSGRRRRNLPGRPGGSTDADIQGAQRCWPSSSRYRAGLSRGDAPDVERSSELSGCHGSCSVHRINCAAMVHTRLQCSREGALAVSRVRETLGKTSSAGYAAACEVLSTADTRAGVYGSSIKSLVVVGDQDTQPFQQAADWFMGALPRAAMSRLSGAHASPIESRQNFVSALTSFLLEIEPKHPTRSG
jgi:hypothetical protein